MSPITSTAALRAKPTVQCGAGWVSGTPGVSTSAAIFDHSICRRSAVEMPAASALATLAASSSNAITCAPPAMSARALASPEAPSPNSAAVLPANVVTGIMRRSGPSSSSQLQRGQAGEREHDRDDPEPNHDLRLGPSLLLEV